MKLFFYFCIALLILAAVAVYYCQSRYLSTTDLACEGVHRFANFQDRQISGDVRSLKIVTWNIGYASGQANNQGSVLSKAQVLHNLHALADQLKALEPDIVFLQEVDFSAKRTHHIDQFAFLAEALAMPFAAHVVVWNKKYVPFPYWPIQTQFGAVASGQVVLSRLPIEAQQIEIFDKPPNPFWYNWFYLERVVQRISVQWRGQELKLWNVHHEAFHAPTRRKQAQRLALDVLQQNSAAKIVAGDFNDPTSAIPHRLHDAEVQDTLTEFVQTSHLKPDSTAFAPDTKKTFPSWAPVDKLDHILISAPFVFKESKVMCHQASDHCLLFVELASP